MANVNLEERKVQLEQDYGAISGNIQKLKAEVEAIVTKANGDIRNMEAEMLRIEGEHRLIAQLLEVKEPPVEASDEAVAE